MIPFLLMRTPFQRGPLHLYFEFDPLNLAESMGTGDSIRIDVDYSGSESVDDIKVYRRIAGDTDEWFNTPSTTAVDFNSSATVWSGAGAYEFYATARRVSSGLYDITSNTITLAVS